VALEDDDVVEFHFDYNSSKTVVTVTLACDKSMNQEEIQSCLLEFATWMGTEKDLLDGKPSKHLIDAN